MPRNLRGAEAATVEQRHLGLVQPHGSISFKGRPIAGLRPEQMQLLLESLRKAGVEPV